MTPKFVLLGIGAAAITSIAVPVSLAKSKKTTNDDGMLPESQEWEEALDSHDASFREQLDETQKLIFDQDQKLRREHQNKKQTERYSNYFLDSSGNQGEWESNFSNAKKKYDLQDKIVYYFGSDSGEPNANIMTGWSSDSTATYDPNNTSLNIFCKHKRDDLSRELLWRLCSFFQERPQTVSQDRTPDNRLNSIKKMGYVFGMFLISPNGNDSFWTKRQSEWQSLKDYDSTYFKYVDNKNIKDLCQEAYYKEIDSTEGPTKDEVLKYCSLDWNF